MKSLLAPMTLLAMTATATPALAEWQWVEDEPARVETRVYEESEAPGYYDQQPRTYYREERKEVVPSAPRTTYYREEYRPIVETNRETFVDGNCEVTRTYMSDGSSHDERLCSHTRLMLPHDFIIDRIGRHFDHLRGYDRDHF